MHPEASSLRGREDGRQEGTGVQWGERAEMGVGNRASTVGLNPFSKYTIYKAFTQTGY